MNRRAAVGRAVRGLGRITRHRGQHSKVAAMGTVVVAALLVGASPTGAAPSESGISAMSASAGPGVLNAIACTSPSSCVAVGSRGSTGSTLPLAEMWNGANWTVTPTPIPVGGSNVTLSGVACGSATACVAVGGYFNGHGNDPLAETWNGISWSIQSSPLPAGSLAGGFASVSCNLPTACIAVGFYADSTNTNRPLAEWWNGTDFSSKTVPLPSDASLGTFDAVTCSPSPSVDCEAVGWNFVSGAGEIAETLAEGWNGTSWSIQNTPIPNDASGGSYPFGISCSRPHACTSVGEGLNGSGNLAIGWAQAWNGTSWSNRTTINPTGGTASLLSAVSCSAAPSTRCTAVGSYTNGATFVNYAEIFKGTKLSIQLPREPKGSTSGAFGGVSCSSTPGTCMAVGDVVNGSGVTVTLADAYSGGKWTVQKTPNP